MSRNTSCAVAEFAENGILNNFCAVSGWIAEFVLGYLRIASVVYLYLQQYYFR